MSHFGKVLVVEDSEVERRALCQWLEGEGFAVLSAANCEQAALALETGVDVVVSDLVLGDATAVELLELCRRRHSHAQFIIVTGHDNTEDAIDAFNRGAYDYVTKPLDLQRMSMLLRRAAQSAQTERRLDELRRRLDSRLGLDQIVGRSKAMKIVVELIRRAAAQHDPVFIVGEAGTGKELTAQSIHHNSPRRDGPFLAVNCSPTGTAQAGAERFTGAHTLAANPDDWLAGCIEQANGGTLFLDDVGELELASQDSLLRVLALPDVAPSSPQRKRSPDVRVIAATRHDLPEMVRQKRFRAELLSRLSVMAIALPPLRERIDDLPLLVVHLLRDISQQKRTPPCRVTPGVMRRFRQYDWPGNVRELRETLESMIVLGSGPLLTEADLPERIAGESPTPWEIPAGITMDDLERLAIRRALEHSHGNRTQAAHELGISVRTLQRKLSRYDTPPPSQSA